MDPEIVYDIMIKAADAILEGQDELSEDDFLDQLYDVGPELAEAVVNLDAWLRRGGFHPDAWLHSDPAVRKSAVRNIADDPADRAHEALTLIHDIRAEAMIRGNSEVAQAARYTTDQIEYLIELLR